MWRLSALKVYGLILLLPARSVGQERVTILYDAFGKPSKLKKDWGFAALIEYAGKRILFDTGNNSEIFRHNVRTLKIDLKKLDAVVISHRHSDHTTGLNHLLKVNPGVRIYVPREGAFFRGELPARFFDSDPSLPSESRYFDGHKPERVVIGAPWERARFEMVAEPTEILPGFHLLTTTSEKPGTMEMNELSLAIRTPRGLAVIVGCSHPGVEKILPEAARIDSRLYTVIGGFHLVATPAAEISRIAAILHDTLKLERVAPGHCTGEPAFAIFRTRFQSRHDEAGLGSTLPLPAPAGSRPTAP